MVEEGFVVEQLLGSRVSSTVSICCRVVTADDGRSAARQGV